MAVALDVLSVGVTNPGPNNHMGKWGSTFTGSGIPFPGFISPSASATLCLVGIAADTITPGTWTVSIGASQMTPIGSQVNVSGTQSITWFGLLNPPSGSQTLTIAATTFVGTAVYGGATFTGTLTSSLGAAAVVTTGTGTSGTAAVTTGDSVQSGDMAIYECGTTTTDITSLTGTTIDIEDGFTYQYGMSYYSGAGAAITGSASLSASLDWGGAIVHVYGPGAPPANPFGNDVGLLIM